VARPTRRLGDAALALGPRDALHLEPERDVLRRAHMREEGIALEHDAETALCRLGSQKVRAVERDGTAARLHEAGDHLQRCRFAAARGAEQRDELALFDAQRELIDGRDPAVMLRQAVENQEAHDRPDKTELGETSLSARSRGSSACSTPRAFR
jgi:hypothetical protein